MRFEYRTRDNSFYRLNPWARIAYLLTLFYLSVLFSGIPLQLEVMALVLLTAFLAGVLKEALYYSRIIIYMSLFLAAISIVFGPGGASIFRIYVFDITVDPVLFSISMTLRLISSVMSFEMVLLTVDPDSVMSVISRLSKKTAGALLISTRLMPVMNNEGQDIMEAFESRGVPVSHGRLMERVRAASHMVFPLLYSSMDRGIAVAESMETRGFPARWKQKREILNTVDRLQISSCIGSVLLLSALSVTGVGEADYYSVPSIMSGFSIAAVVVVFVLNIPYFLLSWRGKVASNQGSEIPV